MRAAGTLEIEQRVQDTPQPRICRTNFVRGRQSEIYAKLARRRPTRKIAFSDLRDANTAALHSSIDWDTLSALYGCQQLGLQPQGIF